MAPSIDATTRRRTLLRCVPAKLLACFGAALLNACAVTEVTPDLRFTRTPLNAGAAASEATAVIGFYSRISEGPLLYNVGVRIVSIDGSDVAAWQGAVIEPGARTIVVRFEAAYPQHTDNITLRLNARPGRKYLVRAIGNSVVDRTFRFWVEDAATREVVVGFKPPSAATVDATPASQALYSRFREALAAAGR